MSDKNTRFERIELLFGREAFDKLAGSCVMVAGLGAVGSYAAEALARSGIGHLKLVDFDVVRESNINRQLYALGSTIGRPKVKLAEGRAMDINPDCRVEAFQMFIDDNSITGLLSEPPDIVIDAIDSVGPKVGLIKAVHARGIRIISCMGAAMRTDPLKIKTGDISETTCCPLARQIRNRLKKAGIKSGVHCIYSTEPVNDDAIAKDINEWEEDEVMPRGRPRRNLGSFSCLTGMFGLIAAREAIFAILEKKA